MAVSSISTILSVLNQRQEYGLTDRVGSDGLLLRLAEAPNANEPLGADEPLIVRDSLDLIGNKSVDVRSQCSRLVRQLHSADSRSADCAGRTLSQS